MKTSLPIRCFLLSIGMTAPLAWGQPVAPENQPNASPLKLERAADESYNQFGLSFRLGFNLSVDFKNLGGFAAKTDPGPPTGGAFNRNYDDGFNRVDVSENQGDQTWYWGYDNASQLQPGSAAVVMHSSSSPAGAASRDRSDDPQLGFEITYNLELFRNESWRWGVEAALGYADLSVQDSRALKASVNRINDAFVWPTEGGELIALPPPGYRGLPDGSETGAPVIGSSPTRTTTVIPGGANITGSRRFNADLFGFRLGPYLQIPLDEKTALSFSAGLALVEVSSDFSFTETVTIADVGVANHGGAGSHDGLQAGYYAAGSIAYQLNRTWGLFGGVQYQDAGKYSHSEAGQQAVLDLGQAFFVTAGLSFSF